MKPIKYLLTKDNIDDIATSFISNTDKNKIFAFYGEMGAGKTTFISALCAKLGIEEQVSSPTFAIVNEYHNKEDDIIYHFDCYRLKSASEAQDIGLEDYLSSGNICFIEWAENIDPILPPDTVSVKLTIINDQERELEIGLPE